MSLGVQTHYNPSKKLAITIHPTFARGLNYPLFVLNMLFLY